MSRANSGPDRKKYLVITSDDFGMCHAINFGITRGLLEGVLTSTTLMAPCPWFPEAVYLTKKHGFKVGVHLTLTCEWEPIRWSPITRAPSLTTPEGYFLTNYPDLVKSANDDEVLREFDAQIARVKAAGIEPTHLDIHMLTGEDDREGVERFRELLRRTCTKHGLVYTRDYNPKSGLLHFDGQLSISGVPAVEIWQTLESWNQPGFYHLIAHAAEPSPELEALCSEDAPLRCWTTDYRGADLRFLTGDSTVAKLKKMGFELIDVPAYFALKQAK